MVHGLRDQIFPQHRSQPGAAIAAARIGGAPRAFELNITADFIGAEAFAQKQGAAITELGVVVAKLMAGVNLCKRLCALRCFVAGKYLSQLFLITADDANLSGQRPVKSNQFGRWHRCCCLLAEKMCRQAAIAVVKGYLECGFAHLKLMMCC